MLDEARKREIAANLALLGIMAATGAQSKKDFVKMGDVESKGAALMQRFGRVRGEAERNLDSGRVSHPARNKTVKECKTFHQFLLEASSHQNTKSRILQLMVMHQNDPEKYKTYKNMLKTYNVKEKPTSPDYSGRESARKDKHLIPSERTSSFPELSGVSTISKDPKKIRKQKALGELP